MRGSLIVRCHQVANEGDAALIFSSDIGSDIEYKLFAAADWPPAAQAHLFIEELWKLSKPFLDVTLPAKVRQNFRAHFWEIYLASALLTNGTELVPRSERRGGDAGPDLLCRDDMAIEAVLATAGQGPDAVVKEQLNCASSVPDIGIRLRLLNAVDVKCRKLERYCETGLHPATAPFVVAINGSRVPYANIELDVPRIVRALFPIGHLQVHIDTETFELKGTSYAHENSVTKLSGNGVRTDGFLVPGSLSGLSAVLYSCADMLNRPRKIGNDFIVVHNPHAHVPIALGVLPAHSEYIFENNAVIRKPGVLAHDF